MHHLYFVLIKNTPEMTSLSARKLATEKLKNHCFEYKKGEYRVSARCNYFVVGGKWTGLLNPKTSQFVKNLMCGNKSNQGNFVKHSFRLQKDWSKMGGKGLNPTSRNPYFDLGFEDDAVLFNTKIKKHLTTLKEDIENNYVYIPSEPEEAQMINIFWYPKKYLNNYWLVLIDYQN